MFIGLEHASTLLSCYEICVYYLFDMGHIEFILLNHMFNFDSICTFKLSKNRCLTIHLIRSDDIQIAHKVKCKYEQLVILNYQLLC